LAGGVQVFTAELEPAAVAKGIFDGDFGFLGFGEGEEAFGFGVRAGDEAFRDAVVLDVEEADVLAGFADFGGGGGAGFRGAVQEGGEVDEGDFGEGDL